MKAVVVYESLWGNTAEIARAIADGIGPDVRALATGEATAEAIAGADLIVAGAPILGFSLPTDSMREAARSEPKAPSSDRANPSMRTWLAGLPKGSGGCAGFETRIWWSPGSSAKAIDSALTKLGYRSVATPGRFLVTGRYGPLKAGEIERARQWGSELAKAAG